MSEELYSTELNNKKIMNIVFIVMKMELLSIQI